MYDLDKKGQVVKGTFSKQNIYLGLEKRDGTRSKQKVHGSIWKYANILYKIKYPVPFTWKFQVLQNFQVKGTR